MTTRSFCGARFGPPGSNPAWKAPDDYQELLWSQIRASWLEPALEDPDESQDALWSQIRASWLEPGLESPR